MKQAKQFIYGIYYPRNFANEYIVYKISAARRAAWAAFEEEASNDPNKDAYRIPRKTAEKLARRDIVDF